jgi:PilZ domain
MAALTCPECGREAVLRYQCLSPLERLLQFVHIYPFRCQLCSHRFLTFSLGRSYPTDVIDRREHVRIPVNMELAFSAGRIRGQGQVLNLSVGGCMIETRASVHRDDIYHLELYVAEGEPPLELSAIVRSVSGCRVGLKFLPSAQQDPRLLTVLRSRAEAATPLQPI